MNLENRVKRLECVVSFLKCNALKEEEAFIFLKSINIDEKTGVTTEDIDVVIEQGNVYLLINPDNTFTLYTIDNEIYVVFQTYNAQTETWESRFNNNEGIIILEYTKTID